MIKQNDKECLPVIQKVGCYARAASAMAEFKTGKELTAKQINELWKYGQKNGYITADNIMKRADKIATKALNMLGCNGRFVEIGLYRKGRFEYYPSVTPHMKTLNKFFIQKIATPYTEGTHFRNVDYAGNVIFDPNEPPIKATDIFYSLIFIYLEN